MHDRFNLVFVEPFVTVCCIVSVSSLKLLQETHKTYSSEVPGKGLQPSNPDLGKCHCTCVHLAFLSQPCQGIVNMNL
jgi:hypothetical protein